MKGFFVTVEIYRCPGWNIFQNLINGGCGIRMSWVENVLKINKAGGTSFRDLRVCSLKFNFELIVIPSSVTDETDFMVISPICNVREPVIPRIIN